MSSLHDVRSPACCLWLVSLLALGCGDVPSLGATRCDYELAACGSTLVGQLDAQSVSTFELAARSQVTPSARFPVDDCSGWWCYASARLLPGPDGDVWLAFSYAPSVIPSSEGSPWLLRVGPDGVERERVSRGARLLGRESATYEDYSGDIVFEDGAGGVGLLRAGGEATLFLQRAGEELVETRLEPLTTTGARYLAPALISDGSLRVREQLPGEAPTSLVVVALEPDGRLRWRQRYAPAQVSEDRTRVAGDPVLPADLASAPLRGFVFEGDRYAFFSAVEASTPASQALVSFDPQGNFVGAVGQLQVEGETLRMAASPTHFAYAVDTLADHGGDLALHSARASALPAMGDTPGDTALGRRVGYYDGAAQALALDAEGGKFVVAITGDYLVPVPVVCKLPAGEGTAECSEIVLCEGELDELVWPFVSPAGVETNRVLDGSAVALGPEVVAVRIIYTCGDAAAAVAMRETTLFDQLSASGAPSVAAGDLAGVPGLLTGDFAVDAGRRETHDELVFLDLSTRVARAPND